MAEDKKVFTFAEVSKGNTRMWSKRDINKIAKLREKGKSYREIGAALNRSSATIYNILKKYRPDALLPKTIDGYLTVNQYAKKYGITAQAVYDIKHHNRVQYIKKDGLLYIKDEKVTRPHRFCSYDEICKMIELREQGMKVKDIVKKMKRCSATVVRHTSFYINRPDIDKDSE